MIFGVVGVRGIGRAFVRNVKRLGKKSSRSTPNGAHFEGIYLNQAANGVNFLLREFIEFPIFPYPIDNYLLIPIPEHWHPLSQLVVRLHFAQLFPQILFVFFQQKTPQCERRFVHVTRFLLAAILEEVGDAVFSQLVALKGAVAQIFLQATAFGTAQRPSAILAFVLLLLTRRQVRAAAQTNGRGISARTHHQRIHFDNQISSTQVAICHEIPSHHLGFGDSVRFVAPFCGWGKIFVTVTIGNLLIERKTVNFDCFYGLAIVVGVILRLSF